MTGALLARKYCSKYCCTVRPFWQAPDLEVGFDCWLAMPPHTAKTPPMSGASHRSKSESLMLPRQLRFPDVGQIVCENNVNHDDSNVY